MTNGSLMGSILHDIRHAKDLKQQPIRDKIELAGQFSGYESGQAAGEIISEIVSFIGPAKLAKIAGKSKLISRLSQVPKIEKGLSYIKQARTMLSDNYLSRLARESYGATKDFFRSRLGNLWDDFSYKKFSFAGLDDFRYGEDIGKHTARFYQSTGESAEYQSILRDLYGDASEQSGRKVGREFSKEASEQLSKHSDDAASTSKGISKKEYNSLRKKTKSQEIRDHVNNVDGEKFDPIYGYPVETLEADHIVSMKEITEMDGFSSLSDVDKVEVLNLEDNFMGLGKPTNSSKGAKTWSDWQGHSKLGDIPAEIREKMIALESEARTKLQNEIFRRLKNDGSA